MGTRQKTKFMMDGMQFREVFSRLLCGIYAVLYPSCISAGFPYPPMAAESLPLTTDDFYPVPGVGISGGKGRGKNFLPTENPCHSLPEMPSMTQSMIKFLKWQHLNCC